MYVYVYVNSQPPGNGPKSWFVILVFYVCTHACMYACM